MNYSKAPGLTLIETSLLLVFASVLMFMVTTRSSVLKVGQAVKVSTEKLTRINSLLEQASTGELAGISPGQPLLAASGGLVMDNAILALNSQISSDKGLNTTYTSGRIPLTINTKDLSNQNMEYTWHVQDISENNQSTRTPKGLRLYNATLKIYKSPSDQQPEAFSTILQVNTREKESNKIGMELLFDDSSSMREDPPNLLPANKGPVRGLALKHNLPTYSDILATNNPPPNEWKSMPIGIPALSGNPLASTTNWDLYKKSTLSWQSQQVRQAQDNAGIINDGVQVFPYLAYRYESKPGYINQNNALYGGPTLDPFDNNQLDITFDLPKNYQLRGQGDGVHTYPGPGVLKLKKSGEIGACDASPHLWASPGWDTALSNDFTASYVLGLASRPNNGSCDSNGDCSCDTLRTWLQNGNKLPDQLFEFNGNAGFENAHYQTIGLSDVLAGGPFSNYALYRDMLDVENCIFQPLIPPFESVDYRENLQRVCSATWPANLSPDDADFSDFKNTYLLPVESARNALIRFLINLENPANASSSQLISSAEIGFLPFNNKVRRLKMTPAKKQLQTVSEKFEDLRMHILSMNRHGAPYGPINTLKGTPTYETLETAIASLSEVDINGEQKYRTRIIVLLTDGEPSTTSSNDVLMLAQTLKAKKITLFIIGMTQSVDSSDLANVKSDMSGWASASWGGEALFVANDDELKAAFDKMNLLIDRQIALSIISNYHYIDENLLN